MKFVREVLILCLAILLIAPGTVSAGGSSDTSGEGYHCYMFFDLPGGEFAQAMVNEEDRNEAKKKANEFIQKYEEDEGGQLVESIGNIDGHEACAPAEAACPAWRPHHLQGYYERARRIIDNYPVWPPPDDGYDGKIIWYCFDEWDESNGPYDLPGDIDDPTFETVSDILNWRYWNSHCDGWGHPWCSWWMMKVAVRIYYDEQGEMIGAEAGISRSPSEYESSNAPPETITASSAPWTWIDLDLTNGEVEACIAELEAIRMCPEGWINPDPDEFWW